MVAAFWLLFHYHQSRPTLLIKKEQSFMSFVKLKWQLPMTFCYQLLLLDRVNFWNRFWYLLHGILRSCCNNYCCYLPFDVEVHNTHPHTNSKKCLFTSFIHIWYLGAMYCVFIHWLLICAIAIHVLDNNPRVLFKINTYESRLCVRIWHGKQYYVIINSLVLTEFEFVHIHLINSSLFSYA